MRFHCSRAAHANFAGFFPEIGIRSIDLRAQVVSRETLCPADVPGICNCARRAGFPGEQRRVPDQGQREIGGLPGNSRLRGSSGTDTEAAQRAAVKDTNAAARAKANLRPLTLRPS